MNDQSEETGTGLTKQIKSTVDTGLSEVLPKVMLGLIPLAGPATLEIVNAWQKKKEEQRLAELIGSIHARIEGVERDNLELKASDEALRSLFEDAVRVAAETQSDEKIGYVGALVAHGILYDHITVDERQYLLNILRQLHTSEVIVLASYADKHYRDEEFHEMHDTVLDIPSLSLNSGLQDAHSGIVRTAFRDKLLQLGLLDMKSGPGGKPVKKISQLGRALLREIGILGPGEM